MLSIQSRIPRSSKRANSLTPVLPLVPIKLPTPDEEKGKWLTFELQTRVGQPATATKYKKQCRKFEEGTPQEWIDLLRDLDEIWTQNAITGASDRTSSVRALVRGESCVTFDAALAAAREGEDGVLAALTTDHISTALDAVALSVFPHRALEVQKTWMNRRMFKPLDLTTRQTSAAINRLNNALPLFPSGTEESKFSGTEIIGLLEWSLPPAWRTKFDLDGYVPTLHSQMRLIESCEAIERNEVVEKDNNKDDGNNNKKRQKNGKSHRAGKTRDNKKVTPKETKYFCSEHGDNSTHGTTDCYTLKNRAKASGAGNGSPNKRSFSNKSFRKELNMLAKKSSKKKVLELYASAVKREQTKLAKKTSSKRKKREESSDSDSDSDMSANLVEKIKPRVKKVAIRKPRAIRKSAAKTPMETIAEETEYQKKVKWLEDHGESDLDEPIAQGDPSTESASEESSTSD